MLIEIDNSITNTDFSISSNLDAIENILFSYAKGEHHVISDTNTTDFLLGLNNLHRRCVGALKKISSNVYSNRAIEEMTLHRIKVVSEGPINKSTPSWIFPLSFFSDHRTCQRTTLMAENTVDCSIYFKLGELSAARKKAVNVRLSLRLHGAGGSAIQQNFESIIIDRECPVICITDGDLTYPSCDYSDVTKTCIRINDNHDWISEVYCIPCRDIENLIPFEIIEESVNHVDFQKVSETCSKLKNIYAAFSAYWDVKEGTNGYWVFKHATNHPARQFWLSNINPNTDLISQCIESDACGHSPCQCEILPSFGKGILGLVYNNLNSKSPHEINKLVKSNSENWSSVGDIILTWGIAPIPQSA